MWRRLIDAASLGDCMTLDEILQEDAKILERIPSWDCVESSLHLASMFGHVQFARQLLEVMSSSTSVKQLNQLNQDGYSPLHLAAANGHLDVVMLLLQFGSMHSFVEDLCVNKDRDGKSPIHGAALRGNIEVINALVAACPESTFELTVQEETILHLAVKYNQCEAFLVLVQQVDFGDFLNFRDRDGNTVFHLAAFRKQFQIIEYLTSQKCLKINTVNNFGLTGLDILITCSSSSIEIKIAEMIRYAGGQRSLNQTQPQTSGFTASRQLETNQICSDNQETQNDHMPGSSGLIVLASLIATAALEAAINPPGGLWQDWDPKNNNTTTTTSLGHTPGHTIFYDLYRSDYKFFLGLNTTVFLTSISIIVALISPTTLKFEFSRLFLARLASLFLVMMLIMLFFQTGLLTTRGKSPVTPATILGWIFWSALNTWFVFSPLIAAIWKMLRKQRK